MAFKRLDAAAAFGGVVGMSTARSDELPHLDRLVEREPETRSLPFGAKATE